MASVDEAAQMLLDCVCEALSTGGRPACTCHMTVGPPMFATCCECDESGSTGDLSIHFQRLHDADPKSLEEVVRIRSCHKGTIAAEYRMVLTRCYPTINEHGELPSPEETTEAAHDMHQDVNLVWHALSCCPDLHLQIADLTVLSDPEAGCAQLVADLAVEVSVKP